MKIAGIQISKKQIILLLVLFIGIIIGVILVQKQQIFKSKADVDISSALNIQGGSGEEVKCEGQTCTTEADEVIIEIKDPNIFLSE